MKKIIAFLSIIVLPIFLIFSFSYLNDVIFNYYALTLSDYIPLYLSILSIELATIIAVVVYRWQYNDDQRRAAEETRQAKQILRVLLTNATARAIDVYSNHSMDDFNFIRITNNQIGLIATLGDLLTEEEFLYLNLLIESLKDMADNERSGYPYEAREALTKYIKRITLPFYPLYHLKIAKPTIMYDVMNNETVNIFNLLQDSDTNKQIQSTGNQSKIYDSSGKLLCNATIDEQGIIDGKAKVFYEGKYLEFKGHFKSRERHGKGTEYFVNGIPGEIKKSGEWKNNQLVNGIAYLVLLNKNNKLFTINDEEYNQLHDHFYSLSSLTGYEDKLSVATIQIKNEKIQIDNDSIIPLTKVSTDADLLKSSPKIKSSLQ